MIDAEAAAGSANPKPRRDWYRVNSRMLLIVLTLAGCGLASLAAKVQEGRSQRAAVSALRQLRGEVYYDYEFDKQGLYITNSAPPGSRWLHPLLGDDFFRNVHWVSIEGAAVTDVTLENLEGLSRLEWLSIKSAPAVTDTGLEHLRRLHDLDELYLEGTQVTSAGIAKLQRALPRCHITRQ